MTERQKGTTRIGFFPPGDSSWLGGVNYFGNIMSAVVEFGGGSYRSVVFVGRKANEDIVSKYARHAEIVRTSILDKGSPAFRLRSVMKRLSSYTPITWILRHHKIDVVSHVTGYIADTGVPSSGWIPDFQHKALPELFTKQELTVRDRDYAALAKQSDILVLSSEAARADALSVEGCQPERIRVLRFPSPHDVPLLDLDGLAALKKVHGLPERYFHLPNQFWRHKNHISAFRALREALIQEPSLFLVCTGSLDATKDPVYAREIEQELEGIGGAVRRLGVIPYRDMLGIMQGAVAVLQPSRFEGWSTSVEEARQLHKRLILSDLAVHREQNVPGARYFIPEDASALAGLLVACWHEEHSAVPCEAFEAGRITRSDFYARYAAILNDLLGRNSDVSKTR